MASPPGISAPGARHAEKILDRTKYQDFAEQTDKSVSRGRRLARKLAALPLDRARHEIVEQPALERRGIGHADLDAGEYIIPCARRGQIDGRRDFSDIAQHRLLPFGDVGGELQECSRADGENEIADPGHRQIGVVIFVLLEIPAGERVADTGQDIAVTQRYPFWHTGRARRMQQHCNVVGSRAPDQIGRKSRIGVNQGAAARDCRVERQQPCGLVGRNPRGSSYRIVVGRPVRSRSSSSLSTCSWSSATAMRGSPWRV